MRPLPGGRSAAEPNLTTLNRIASFLNVAPVMARNDVMIEEMTDSEWYLSGRSVGATSISGCVKPGDHA